MLLDHGSITVNACLVSRSIAPVLLIRGVAHTLRVMTFTPRYALDGGGRAGGRASD